MRLRPVRSLPLLVALVAFGTPALAATAAPARKPVCNLLQGSQGGGGIAGTAPQLDILSGDVASGPKLVAGTLRLRDVDWRNNQFSRLGLRWLIRWEAKGNTYIFTMRYSGSGEETLTFTRNGTAVGKPTLKVIPATKSVEWSVERKDVKELTKQTYQKIAASSYHNGVSQDGVTATKTYTDQWPSCFKVK